MFTRRASRTSPNPRRYLPRSAVCSTKLRASSAPSNRNAVDLWTPISVASSLTPPDPQLANNSRTCNARSTDCKPPGPLLESTTLMLLSPEGCGCCHLMLWTLASPAYLTRPDGGEERFIDVTDRIRATLPAWNPLTAWTRRGKVAYDARRFT